MPSKKITKLSLLNFKSNPKKMTIFVIFLFIIFINITPIYDIIMHYFNSFEKTITIKNISRRRMTTVKRKHIHDHMIGNKHFTDENGIKYKWANSLFFGKYNVRAENKKLKIGNKVNIKGYNVYYLPFFKKNIVYDIY